jgi:hypothetical protein
MAANRNLDGLNATSAIFDDYTPPTPEERGDFVEDDEAPADDVVDELEDEHEEADELEEEADEEDDGESEEDESESEGEDDVDGDEGEEDEPAEKPSKVAKGRRVPLERLNKEIEKRRNLESVVQNLRTEIDALKGAGSQEPQGEQQTDPVGFTREEFEGMQEAMLDGETDKAFELFGKMMASQTKAVQAKAEQEVSERVRNELNQDRAMSELQQTAQSLAEKYPELDSAGDEADEGLIEEVVEMRDLYVERGLTPAEALKKSVRLVALENDLVDRTAKPKADMAKPTKKTNTKAKLAAAKKERGKLSGTGGGNSRPDIDISRMSDDEFAGLSAEAKARARGDYID